VSGDTVNFAAGLTGTITLTSGEITIDKNLTITGPGSDILSISGNNASRIFNLSGGITVGISDLTFQNGQSGGGGAITDSANSLTLDDCVFANNDSGGNGGAIFAIGAGTIFIDDCTFSANTAVGNGGVIDSPGLTLLSISDSTFDGNSCGASGGA